MNKGVALIILILALSVSVSNVFGQQINPLEECANALESRLAYGVYMDNQKVGWAIEGSKIMEYGEEMEFVEFLEMKTVLNVSGNNIVSELQQKVAYSLKDEGQIIKAERESKVFEENDLKETTAYLTTRKDKRLFIVKKVEKNKVLEKFIPMSKDTLAQSCTFVDWINNPSRVAGDTIDSFSFDQELSETGYMTDG
jgi:hypothetical protein